MCSVCLTVLFLPEVREYKEYCVSFLDQLFMRSAA